MSAKSDAGSEGPRLGALACLALFLVAFAVRAAYLVELAETPFADERALIEDTIHYDQRAREVAAGDWLGSTVAYLSPLYGDVLGGWYALAGPDLVRAKWLQALLGALTCVLLARVGERLFGARVGLLAGAGLALYGLHVYYTGLLLPTTLVAFLNVLVLWLLVPGRREHGAVRWLFGGVVVGLATLAKGNAILLLPAFLLERWLAGSLEDDARRQRALTALALVAGFAIGVAPNLWRNHHHSGEVVLSAANGGLNLLKGNGPTATGTHTFLSPGVTDVNLKDFIAHEVSAGRALASDARMKAEAWQYVREHPARTLDLARVKLGLALHPRELGIRDQYRFQREHSAWLGLPWLSFAIVGPLGLAGAFFACRRPRPRRGLGLLYGMLLVQLATLLIVFVLARYRLVAAITLILFASAELERWLGLLRERRRASLGLAAGVLALCALYAWTPVRGFRFTDPFADSYRFLGDAHERAGEYERAIQCYRAGRAHPWASGLEDTRAMDRYIRRNERKLERAGGAGTGDG